MNVFVIVLLLGLNTVYSEWLDPHEMKFNMGARKLKRGPTDDAHDLNYDENKHAFKERWTKQKEESSVGDEETLMFMKRFVNLIYYSLDVDIESTTDTESSASIHFLLRNEDMRFLSDFSKLTVLNISKLSELNEVLSNAIQPPSLIKKQTRNVLESMSSLLEDGNFIYYLIIGLIVLFSCQCYKNQTPVGPLLKYMLFCTFLVCIYLLYQEEVKEQKKIDDRVCTESPWYAALFGSKEDCKEIVRKHPFLNVIGVVIEGFFVKPFHYLGSGLGGFCYRFFGNLSFFQTFTVGPIVLLLFFIMFFVGLMLVMGNSLELKIFPFMRMKLGSDRTTRTLPPFENRKFVEEVVQDRIKESNVKEEEIKENIEQEEQSKEKSEGCKCKCKQREKDLDLTKESDTEDDNFEKIESIE